MLQQVMLAQMLAVTAARVLVYGSTPAGCAAAIAAARHNESVTLLSATPHIGGMMSGGLSCVDAVGRRTVGGIAKEYMDLALAQYRYENIGHPYCFASAEPHVLLATFLGMLASAGVKVVLDAPLESVTVDAVPSGGSRRITAVVAGGASYAADVVIDASYEGDVMASAGITYTVGREANTTYREPHAGRRPLQMPCYSFSAPVSPFNGSGGLLPLVSARSHELGPVGDADAKVTAYNYRVCLTNASTARVELVRPAGYDGARFELVRRYLRAAPPSSIHELIKLYAVANVSDGFKCDVNNIGPLSTDLTGGSWAYPEASPPRRREIAAAHEKYIRGLLWFLASDSSVPAAVRAQMRAYAWCEDEFGDTDHFPPQLYVREARRMVGAAVVTENSLQSAAELGNESIAMGLYSFDCHPVQIVADEQQATTSLEGCIGASPRRAYQIPYGAITPRRREGSNLLVPVALSASHVAFSTIRMELTWMAIGHAAGVAAAMATAAVQDVDRAELQAQLLREGQVTSLGGGS